jgi:predicted transcriptional regulator
MKLSNKPLNAFEDRWGEETGKMGWTAIPVSLIFLQADMGIGSNEMNVLLNLIMHWWSPDKKPFPSQMSIAHRMGVSKRTVQRALSSLETLRLIEKVPTSKNNPTFKGRNIYDLSPLVRLLDSASPALRENLEKKPRKIQ